MWLAGGLALMAVELVTPSGFFVMFFGVGAVLTGLAVGVGLVPGAVGQWSLFTVASVLALLVFRDRAAKDSMFFKIQARVELTGARPPVDSLVGDIAFCVEVIAPGAVGRVELRGSDWEARNDAGVPLGPKQRCRVIRVTGLQLGVVAE